MDIKKISFRDMGLILENPTQRQFNASFHTVEETPDAILPTEAPYSFDQWLPLIMESRGISPSQLQVATLSPAQARLIMTAAEASIHTRALNKSYAEDLEDEVYPAFRKLVFPSSGLFTRLVSCSPKDGVTTQPGRSSLHSVADVLLQLTTSQRACNSLLDLLRDKVPKIEIFFLPFDPRMKGEFEYRVFCMPETLRVTAISQYRWHKQWAFSHKSPMEMETIASRIVVGVQGIHSRILQECNGSIGTDSRQIIRQQGLTFDVLYREDDEKCVLIEVNVFGARSGCGPCLFHWIHDRRLLYGEESKSIEFRVAFSHEVSRRCLIFYCSQISPNAGIS